MMTKHGLVMEGGAMRGMFTAGVTDVLYENGISFDGAVGVSAGAAFGCNFKSNQPGRALRYNTAYCRDKRYCSWHSLITTGDMFGADFCYRKIPLELDPFDTKAFAENPMEFFVVCTDIVSGNPVYKKCENGDMNDIEWFRASASMPLASRIVEIDGMRLLDGGISDSIPLEFFEKSGYGKNVVILTQPRGYKKEKNRILPLLKLSMHKYPNFVAVAANRHNIYNAQINHALQAEKDGNALIICPPEKLPVGRIEHNPEMLRKTYNIGRKTASEMLDKIRSFLDES